MPYIKFANVLEIISSEQYWISGIFTQGSSRRLSEKAALPALEESRIENLYYFRRLVALSPSIN